MSDSARSDWWLVTDGHVAHRAGPRTSTELRGGGRWAISGRARCRHDGRHPDVVLLGQRRRRRDAVRVPTVAPHRRHAHHLATAATKVSVERDVNDRLSSCWCEEQPRSCDVRFMSVMQGGCPAVDQLNGEERCHQRYTHDVQYHQHLHHFHLHTQRTRTF